MTKPQPRHTIVSEDLADITSRAIPFGRLAGKTVLITGANGFLPAYMVETLLYLNETRDLKIRVVGIVRDKKRAAIRFAHYKKRRDLRLIEQDVCKPLSIAGPVEYIIHAASQASPKYYGRDPVGTLLANTVGTRNYLELARKKRSSGFLFFSAGEIYSQLDTMAIRSCYGESKRMGETMCAAWSRQFGVPTYVVRPFHTYGPGMRLDDGRVFSDFVSDILSNRDITLHSNGEAIRQFCYSADATAGFFTVMLKGKSGQAYDIANPKAETSIRGLAAILAAQFKLKVVYAKRPRTKGYIASPTHSYSPAIQKARAIGWHPRHSIKSGFGRTVESYKWRAS